MLHWFKVHLVKLPRWFAVPFFGISCLLGSVVSGSLSLDAWLALITVLLVMAGGHSFNSFFDYAWTGLDKGEKDSRSAEKSYTGGQNLIENGDVTVGGVFLNAITWYIVSVIPMAVLLYRGVTPFIILPYLLGMGITAWYSWGKFNFTHELSLAVACIIPAIIGGLAVNNSPDIIRCVLVAVPVAIILSFAGLALDEWPDAEANLKKGVKSLAYKVWEYSSESTDDWNRQHGIKSYSLLRWYLSAWLLFMIVSQMFLISIGYLKPLTALSFFAFPGFLACMVFLPANFDKTARWFVIVGALYPLLMLVGQLIGG